MSLRVRAVVSLECTSARAVGSWFLALLPLWAFCELYTAIISFVHGTCQWKRIHDGHRGLSVKLAENT